MIFGPEHQLGDGCYPPNPHEHLPTMVERLDQLRAEGGFTDEDGAVDSRWGRRHDRYGTDAEADMIFGPRQA